MREAMARHVLESSGGNWGRFWSREEVEALFDEVEMVEPGAVKVNDWHSDGLEEDQIGDFFEYGGAARKV